MGPQSASAPSTTMNPSTSHYDAFHHLDTGDYQFDLHPAQPAQPNILNALASPSSLQREWVLYYFEHVRMMQYVFAGNAVTNIIHSVSASKLIHITHLIHISLLYSLSCRNRKVPSPMRSALWAVFITAALGVVSMLRAVQMARQQNTSTTKRCCRSRIQNKCTDATVRQTPWQFST